MQQVILEFPKAKNIVVSGDIHGDFKALVYKCCMQYQITDSLILVAGDCGFGFERQGYYESVYKKCIKRLQRNNNWIVFIRGNHDNPAYFDGKRVNYKRWKAVQDYTIIKACGHTILCVGGAISIDRTLRQTANYLETGEGELTPYVYWPNEPPVYDETKLDAINKICAVDIVVTHTSPSFCERSSHIFLESWAIRDKTLLEEVANERKVMDNIQIYLHIHNHPVQYWFYGHFHESWHSEINDIKYRLLDIMELAQVYD